MKKLLILFALLAVCSAYAEPTAYDKLSQDQRLGQTLFAFTDIDNVGKYKAAIEQGLIGGVLIQWGNYSLKQTKEIIDRMQGWAAKSPHKIPLLIAIDYEGGTVYTPVTLGFEFLPTNMMIAAANDEALASRLFYLAGTQLKQTGVHINFAPVLDVNTNPLNPIIGVRAFGSKPEVVSRMGLAVIDGLSASGIFPVAKHFPGHGATATDSHYTLPVLNTSKKEMEEIHLYPFQKAIDHGVQGVMGSHIIFNAYDPAEAATYSKKILVDLLQQKMGFKGIIVTDALDMKGAFAGSAKTPEQIKAEAEYKVALSTAKTIEAGSDIALLGWGLSAEKITEQIKKMTGTYVSQKRIAEASKKVYDLKVKMGLFAPEDTADAPAVLKSYRAAAEEISQKSVTVLRDRKKTIPVFFNKKKPKVCSVFFVPSRFSEQMTEFQKPFLAAGWDVDFYNAFMYPKTKDYKRVQSCMKKADLVVLGSLQWSGKTSPSQMNIINKVFSERHDAVLLSLLSPYDALTYKQADTVLLNFGISKYSVKAAADILLGNIEASGVLPVEIE